MLTTYGLLIVLVLFLAGCAQTHPIDLQADPSLAEINRLGARKNALVTIETSAWVVRNNRTDSVLSHTIEVSALQVTPDSTSWHNNQTGQFETIATNRIRAIQFKDAGEGAVRGVGLGFIVGAIGGYAVGDALNDTIIFTPTQERVLTAFGFGILGGLVGLVYGGGRGHRDVYQFNALRPAPDDER